MTYPMVTAYLTPSRAALAHGTANRKFYKKYKRNKEKRIQIQHYVKYKKREQENKVEQRTPKTIRK